jgi:CxxC motif-containing protein
VTTEEKIICVGCPMGCLVTLTINNEEVEGITGNRCKQGERYVLEEYRNPVRTLTTTLLTLDSSQPLLPVRTAVPILKTEVLTIAKALADVRAKPPIKTGEVVVSGESGIGVDVVATADLLS